MPKIEFPLMLSSPPMKGELVKEAQRALANSRFGDFYDGKIDGEYGELTAQACYRAKYWCGYTDENLNQAYGADLHKLLTGDAKLSPAQQQRRRKRQKESRSRPLAERALARAITQLGVKENPPGSNLVKYIEWWGKLEWGTVVRFPWCFAFVTWCYNLEGSTALDPRQSRHRYVPYGVADARAGRNGLVLASTAGVRPGNLVMYDWDGGVADHVGLFERWKVPGQTFYAIEGNTAVGNDSDGGQVMRRERSVRQVEVFARVTQ
jgi:peptidoglycan hydrolase-like protein with peptidoglycan-binding domain